MQTTSSGYNTSKKNQTKNDLSMQVNVVAASKIKEISMPPCLQQYI